ncbi:hypothetical protein CBL_06091 [Carabus blaptoides fortunei]
MHKVNRIPKQMSKVKQKTQRGLKLREEPCSLEWSAGAAPRDLPINPSPIPVGLRSNEHQIPEAQNLTLVIPFVLSMQDTRTCATAWRRTSSQKSHFLGNAAKGEKDKEQISRTRTASITVCKFNPQLPRWAELLLLPTAVTSVDRTRVTWISRPVSRVEAYRHSQRV